MLIVCSQFHALGLLYHIRKSDRLAVSKLVTKYARSALKSPYAVCMLVSGEEQRMHSIGVKGVLQYILTLG